MTTLVLDMGGVVIPTLFETVTLPGFPSGPLRAEPAYTAVERGDVGEREYWAALLEQRPDLDLAALWQRCSRVRSELREAIDRIAGRVRLVAFTNDMAKWFGEDWPDRFAELALFDAVLEASKLGALKPAPESFHRALAAIDEEPGWCLFLDDLPVNLAAAASQGLQTLPFDVRDPGGSVARLLARLGLADEPDQPVGAVFRVPRGRR